MTEVKAARAKGQPTIPSTIGLEKQTNPFLRPQSDGDPEKSGYGRMPATWRCSAKSAARKDNF